MMPIPIYESKWLCTVVTKWRGIPDPRRPNGKKPFYRRVTIQIPKAYFMEGAIYAHPSLVEELKKQVTK